MVGSRRLKGRKPRRRIKRPLDKADSRDERFEPSKARSSQSLQRAQIDWRPFATSWTAARLASGFFVLDI